MRTFQTKSLPEDWFQQVNDFDIELSTLSKNNKLIANTLIPFIKSERNTSLFNPLARSLIKHIVFGYIFLDRYNNLPVELVESGMKETNGEKGLNFTRKLHSIFIEFITYNKLNKMGFSLRNIVRGHGDCDLAMKKNNYNYNFEVKFKESKDIFKSRLLDNIDGMSLLNKYSYLRGKTFEIFIKSKNIDYKIQKEILEDINDFLKSKQEIHIGTYIDIFNMRKRNDVTRDIPTINKYIDTLIISQDLIDEDTIYNLIQKIFIDNNGHITKLIKKSSRIENFNGCLVWNIPFHNDIDCDNIKKAFKRLKLEFDLYVFIGGIGKKDCDFIISQ